MRGTLVLHSYDAPTSTLVGFVVSKRVGNAVTRNRVKRQLRHLVRANLDALGSRWIVVRLRLRHEVFDDRIREAVAGFDLAALRKRLQVLPQLFGLWAGVVADTWCTAGRMVDRPANQSEAAKEWAEELRLKEEEPC